MTFIYELASTGHLPVCSVESIGLLFVKFGSVCRPCELNLLSDASGPVGADAVDSADVPFMLYCNDMHPNWDGVSQ